MDKQTVESLEKVRDAFKALNDATMELKETNMRIVENLHQLHEPFLLMEKELIALQAKESQEGNFKN